MTDGATLLNLARQAILSSFAEGEVEVPADGWLQTPAAVFVTLRQHPDGALRGCVGSIDAHLPLGAAVVQAALAAAARDPRFAPLRPAEFDAVRVEVSVLSLPVALPVIDEAHARAQLAGTRPGVILRCGARRGVFLPKVWDSVADQGEFLEHLKLKAGLSRTFWSADVRLEVFTCDEFVEDNT